MSIDRDRTPNSERTLCQSDIKKMGCKIPPLNASKNQTLSPDTSCVVSQPDGSVICYLPNVLSPEERQKFIAANCGKQFYTGKGMFGSTKPRYEIAQSNGGPVGYSGKNLVTESFSENTLHLSKQLLAAAVSLIGSTKDPKILEKTYKLDDTILIVYSDDMKGGGSIGRHRDDESDWEIVIIYTVGQTRILRVRNDETGNYTNVPMADNSMTVMYGRLFQQQNTHQVDRLSEKEPIGVRLTINMRYVDASNKKNIE